MRSWRALVGTGISLVFLYVAFRGQDFGDIRDALGEVNLAWTVPALVLYFVGVWVRAIRWAILMRPLARVTARQLFPIVVVGYMANNVLPLRAGELVRSVVLRQRLGIRKSSALATIAIERIFDGVTMLTFMLVATAFVSFTSQLENLAVIAFVLFAVLLVGLVVLTFGGSLVDRMLQAVLGPMPDQLAERVERMANSFLHGLGVLQKRRDLALVAALSFAAWSFEASMYWVLAIGFGGSLRESLGVAETLLTTGVANMATLIPSSPGYVGQFEYGVKLVLNGALGIPVGSALAYAILLHALLYFPVTIWGIWVWFRQQLSLKAIQSENESAPDDRRLDVDGRAVEA